MPYKSQAQRRLFHWLESQGKLAHEKVHEYDTASKGKKLPERVKKAFGGMVDAKAGTHCPACDLPLDSAPVATDAGEGCPRCGYGSAKQVPLKMAEGGEVPEPAYRQRLDQLRGAMADGLRGAMKEQYVSQKRYPRPHKAGYSQGTEEATEPTTYRAHGGEIKCAHCGEMNYVPNKAHGGMAPEKDEYVQKKTANVDDGKLKMGFAKALKGRHK